MTRKYAPPTQTPADRAYALTRAGISGIPVVGNVAAETLLQVLKPAIDRQLDEWRKLVGERLLRLEAQRGVDLNQLSTTPEFIDAAMTATQAALRTSQRGKLEALRNAVLNSALPS